MDSDDNRAEFGMGVPGTGWLCGFRFDPEREYPELYSIMLEDRQSGWPVLAHGRIVFFTRLELAHAALNSDDDPRLRLTPLPPISIDETYVFDVPDLVRSIAYENEVYDVRLLEFLNLTLDLANASGVKMPASYRRALHGFANHLTISKDVRAYFTASNISRTTIVNAVYWCLGAIASRASILT